MASFSISKRQLKSGELRYTADIIVKKESRIIHRESKTFRKKEHARGYALRRIDELENPEIHFKKSVPLYVLMDKFMNDHDLWSQTGRTKQYVIKMLRDCEIAKVISNELTSYDLVQHCRDRKNAGASPTTIYHDVAYLRSVMKKAHPVFKIDANYSIFAEAVPILIDMALIGKSNKRTRRPTDNELDQLRTGLEERQNRQTALIPYLDILDFSILTCMRIGEVCAIRWDDLNEAHKTVLVRDRKDPRKKTGNHMIVPLLGESFDIVMRQPKTSPFIFPYNSRSVTAGFQRVRNALGIKDLRYHDLRREGASRLFEKGYSIEEVAQVTGHRNLSILWQVYTQLFPHKLHDKFK